MLKNAKHTINNWLTFKLDLDKRKLLSLAPWKHDGMHMDTQNGHI